MDAADVCAAKIMSRQIGLITRRQAKACRLSDRQIAVRLSSRLWIDVHPGVYRSACAPRSWDQDVLAACLSAGPSAAASHVTAALLRRLIDRRRREIHVTVPFRAHPEALGFVVHRSRLEFEPEYVGPIPVMSPARTLIDLAGMVDRDELAEALDIALRRRLVVAAELLARVNELSGRRGLRTLRELLAVRAGRSAQNNGVFATRFEEMLRKHGLPSPEVEYVITRGGRFVAQVDMCYPRERLVIELDGWERHSSPEALERDNVRQNAIEEAGYTVRRFTWNHLDRPKYAVGVVRRALFDRGHPDVVSV